MKINEKYRNYPLEDSRLGNRVSATKSHRSAAGELLTLKLTCFLFALESALNQSNTEGTCNEIMPEPLWHKSKLLEIMICYFHIFSF